MIYHYLTAVLGTETTQVTSTFFGIPLASPSRFGKSYLTIPIDADHATATIVCLAVAFVVNGTHVMLTGTADRSFHIRYL